MKIETKIEEKLNFIVFTEPLTRRELEILQLIERGFSNQEISGTLDIAISTTKKHVVNIYGKLGAKRRAQAVALARNLGVL